MRIFANGSFQFRVTPPQSVIILLCLPQFTFQPGESRLELVNLLGLALNGPLLLVWLGRAGERQSAEELFEEADDGRWALQVGLVDLVRGRHQPCSSNNIKRGVGL
jgi:hypothetical protein